MFSLEYLLLAEQSDRRNMMRIHRRQLRDSTNPFDFPEERFKELFRLTRPAAHQLIQELDPYMRHGQRKTFVPIPIKVCAALNFFAVGSYTRCIGQNFAAALSKTMIFRIVEEVSSVIQNHLMKNYIKFPSIDQYDNIKLR